MQNGLAGYEQDFNRISGQPTYVGAFAGSADTPYVDAYEERDRSQRRRQFASFRPVSDDCDYDDPTSGNPRSVTELTDALSVETKLVYASRILRAVMLLRAPTLIRDRKFHLVTYRRCMVGTEMVDWMLQQHSLACTTRLQAIGLWEALLEQGLLLHVSNEYPFLDKYLFYRWSEDEGAPGAVVRLPTGDEQLRAEKELDAALHFLATLGPDALFKMILQKPTPERAPEELELVYEELMHVKALSHLSTMVKRELASVMVFEQHPNAGTVLFNQGDEGKSWYIVLKGSVNVVIHGKGAVCTLHEGDDFGKLALVNDAPRAATIVLRDHNCQFLRVDKHHFNRILRDVEANTVRLKEHGQDVLVLEKIPIRGTPTDASSPLTHRYSVMAGTPEKMLEYVLETRIDSQHDDRVRDTFLEDFVLTHIIFMPSNILCNSLTVYYQQGCSVPNSAVVFEKVELGQVEPNQQMCTYKKRVVSFLKIWVTLVGLAFFYDHVGASFVEELRWAVMRDSKVLDLSQELVTMEHIMGLQERAMQLTMRSPAIVLDCGVLRSDWPMGEAVMHFDLCMFKIHNIDQTYFTLRMPVNKRARDICQTAVLKMAMGTGQGVELIEVKSSGERVVFLPNDISVPSMMSLNGRLFISFKDQIENLAPLTEQDGPYESVHSATLELLSSSELAYQLALFHWQLLLSTHDAELVVHTLGRDRFPGKIPINLDLLVRRFNEVQYWVTTEVILCQHLAKRVHLLKKFIKIAIHSKSHQDLLSFFAIILGLSNIAVSRLTLTWEKLPTKFRKQFLEAESLLDPSRNHRAYRLLVMKMRPPLIPFVPLLLKDLTFTNDGNKSYFDGLVNFEKMHMISQTLRHFRWCKSERFEIDGQGLRNSAEAQQLVRNFKVIDNQKQLMHLSYLLESHRHKVA